MRRKSGSFAGSDNTPPRLRSDGTQCNTAKSRGIICGPETFSIAEAQAIRKALEDFSVASQIFIANDEFRIEEFQETLSGCSWLLLALGQYPGRELDMLRRAEQAGVDKIGFICLVSSDALSSRRSRNDGTTDLVIVRTPKDHALLSPSRHTHSLVVPDLIEGARDIARAMMVGMRTF